MFSAIDLQSVLKINLILCENQDDESAKTVQLIETDFPKALTKAIYLTPSGNNAFTDKLNF